MVGYQPQYRQAGRRDRGAEAQNCRHVCRKGKTTCVGKVRDKSGVRKEKYKCVRKKIKKLFDGKGKELSAGKIKN